MMRLLGAAAAFAAICLFSSPAAALGPIVCSEPGATTPAEMVGAWHLRQRDDGHDWVDVIPHVFANDGTFTVTSSQGVRRGHWCVVNNLMVWGFDGDGWARTTYRVIMGPAPMYGTMSWDGGGTGEVQVQR